MLPSRLGLAVRSSRAAAVFHKRTFRSRFSSKRPAPAANLRCFPNRQLHGLLGRARAESPDFPHIQMRGKRTKTVVSLDDLPQGLIHADSLPPLPPDEKEPPAAPS